MTAQEISKLNGELDATHILICQAWRNRDVEKAERLELEYTAIMKKLFPNEKF